MLPMELRPLELVNLINYLYVSFMHDSTHKGWCTASKVAHLMFIWFAARIKASISQLGTFTSP